MQITNLLRIVAPIACVALISIIAEAESATDQQATRTSTVTHPKLLHFWVGQWDCYSTKGGPLNGRNEITARLNETVIHEKWSPQGNATGGESWNYYDPTSKTWRQHWMDAQGRSFVFVGKAHEDGILFEGPHLDGRPSRNRRRIYLRPIENGRVRQTGTQSNDGGQSWRPEYDLIYVPRGEAFDADQPAATADPAREFDFLIGEWIMHVTQYDPQGNVIRKLKDWSRVRTMIDGASLIDEWGGSGFTVRTWDPQKKVWRLFWTDKQGSAGKMQFWEGTFEDGVGTFIGGASLPGDTKRVTSKIEFSEIQEDSVLWKMWKSPDNGKTWVLDYVRNYERADDARDVVTQSQPQPVQNTPSPLQLSANQQFTAGNFDQAAKLYSQLIDQQPNNVQAWFRLGYSLHAAGQLDEAINAHKQTASFGGNLAPVATYNLACAYSLQEKTEDAIAALQQAIKLGFNNLSQLQNDSDLNHIREDERVQEIIKQLGG